MSIIDSDGGAAREISLDTFNNPNLSPPLRTVPPAPPGARRLNLTQQQKDALVAFLRTLTDPNLANDPKLSDPFNYSDYAGD